MFSDVYQLRAGKFAQSIEFVNEQDGQEWEPLYGRNPVDAAESFIFHEEDGPPYPHFVDKGKADRKRGEKGLQMVVVPRSIITFAKPPVLLENLTGLTGKHLWVYGGAERLRVHDIAYEDGQPEEIYNAIMVSLRHDPLVVPDSAATFDIAEFFVMFRKEFKDLTGWYDDTPIGALIHAINWGCDSRAQREGNRAVTIWEDKGELEKAGIGSWERKPLRISATSGHSIDCVDEHVCVKMLYDPDDEAWPHTLVHHTTHAALASILSNRCLVPGGTKSGNELGKKRPIFAESVETSSVELAARKGGYAHRAGCTAALFINMLGLKRACAMSYNRVGICGNGAVCIFKEVPIAQFLRIEIYGEESLPYDIWRHPKVCLEFQPCPECASKGINTLVPTGTDICWNSHCGYPISDKGLVQYLRIYGMDENLSKLARFFRTHGSRLSPEQQANLRLKLRHEPTDHAVRFGRAVPKGTPPTRSEGTGPVPTERHFSELSRKEKAHKLMKMAKAACRKDHIGIHDPNDVSQWLLEPAARKYHGHTERMNCDPEYKAQCERNGCVDEYGHLAQWVESPNGEWYWKDYEIQFEREKLAASRKGGEKGKPSAVPQGSGKGRPSAAPGGVKGKPSAAPGGVKGKPSAPPGGGKGKPEVPQGGGKGKPSAPPGGGKGKPSTSPAASSSWGSWSQRAQPSSAPWSSSSSSWQWGSRSWER